MISRTAKAPERAQASTGCREGSLGHNVSPPNGGYVIFSPRVRLVPLSVVGAIRGEDHEKIMSAVDEMINPAHIRFAFNLSLTPDRSARDLRFWINELAAPALVRKFSLLEAIGEILGARKFWPRGELEIAWNISTHQIIRLIRAKLLKLEGRQISRSCLEAFLWVRATQNNPT